MHEPGVFSFSTTCDLTNELWARILAWVPLTSDKHAPLVHLHRPRLILWVCMPSPVRSAMLQCLHATHTESSPPSQTLLRNDDTAVEFPTLYGRQ